MEKTPSFIIVTTPTIDNKTIVSSLGLVTGEASNLAKTNTDCQNALRESTRHAIAHLEENAQKLGATGIVDVRIDHRIVSYSHIDSLVVIATVYGTAVFCVDND